MTDSFVYKTEPGGFEVKLGGPIRSEYEELKTQMGPLFWTPPHAPLLADYVVGRLTPDLSVQSITSLNALLTILSDCQEVCKNGNVRVRKGRRKLYSQAMLRLVEMSANEITMA